MFLFIKVNWLALNEPLIVLKSIKNGMNNTVILNSFEQAL